MPIVQCPSCQQKMRVADSAGPQKFRCQCGNILSIGGSSPASPPTSTSQAGPQQSTNSSRPAGASSATGSSDAPITFGCGKCGATMRVAAAHAGKNVRCKCGEICKVPTANSATPAPRPQAPAPAPASPFGGDLGGAWDELTDTDLSSGSYVPPTPTTVIPRQTNEGSVLHKYLPDEVGKQSPYASPRPAAYGGSNQGAGGLAPRPVFLVLISIWNYFWMLLYGVGTLLVLGVATFMAGDEEAMVAVPMMGIFGAVLGILCLLSGAVGTAVWFRAPWAWMVCMFSYAYSLGDRISGLVFEVMNMEGFDPSLVGQGGGLMVGIGILLIFRSNEVRNYFQVKGDGIVHSIIVNVTGILLGAIVTGAVLWAMRDEFDEDAEAMNTQRPIPRVVALDVPSSPIINPI